MSWEDELREVREREEAAMFDSMMYEIQQEEAKSSESDFNQLFKPKKKDSNGENYEEDYGMDKILRRHQFALQIEQKDLYRVIVKELKDGNLYVDHIDNANGTTLVIFEQQFYEELF